MMFPVSQHRMLSGVMIFANLAHFLKRSLRDSLASQAALVVKNPPASAGDVRVTVSVSGWGRSPGEGNATHLSILAWGIPWTEEPGGLQSMGTSLVVQWLILHAPNAGFHF